MTLAERYRENHRKLMKRQKQEEPWSETLKVCGAFVLSVMIWLALFMVLVPKM